MRTKNMNELYPTCICGSKMNPVWCIEEERDDRNIKTGRRKKACSHFECPLCFRKECVDDTFDGEWR